MKSENTLNHHETLKLIRQVVDFPKPGIVFYDISTLLSSALGFKAALDLLEDQIRGLEFDKIAAIDSRGFIFGAALADRTNVGLVLIRKAGKLPGETDRVSYNLEYGSAQIEICQGALTKGERIIVVDDLLATGGTASAAQRLVELQGAAVVAHLFLLELVELNGRSNLTNSTCKSVFKV